MCTKAYTGLIGFCDRQRRRVAHVLTIDPDPLSSMRQARGLSQTPGWVANRARPISVLRFVNLWKSKAEPEQPVLLVDRPVTGEAEPLP